MEGTNPAAMREFFLVGAGKVLRCHKLAPGVEELLRKI
jgi:hypothetical protein